MKREPGYYWVKHKDNWTIAKWNLSPFGDVWYVWNWIGDLNDSEFEEISERRITCPNEQPTQGERKLKYRKDDLKESPCF